jgi:SAM-dependent methyltransferase
MTELAQTRGAAAEIVESVRRVYEKFPYPHYPLFAGLRWEDGYAASSEFAAQLLEDIAGREAAIRKRYHTRLIPATRTVLVGGSGDTLPYVLRHLEPSHHRLLCVDLSQRSLRRARLRLLTSVKRATFVRQDIDRFLEEQGLVTGPYDHVDLYGVLHHLPNPSRSLHAIADRMSPDGTMRLMVYNSESRHWIREVQAAIRDLRLDPFVERDLESVRALLVVLASVSERFAIRMRQIGSETVLNPARLVDTFMHPREAKLSLAFWLQSIESAGLQPLGLLDRYGELDDLPNPLWAMPSAAVLRARAEAQLFQNNFEIYLVKRPSPPQAEARKTDFVPASRRWLLPFLLQGPPAKWFAYEETASLSRQVRWRLWMNHCRFVNKHQQQALDPLIQSMPLRSAQRLARIGAILPGQVESIDLRARLAQAMGPATHAAQIPAIMDLRGGPVAEMVMGLLQEKANFSDRRYRVIMQRLARALA